MHKADTYTLTDAISKSPFGSAVKTSEERAMVAKRAIMHEESRAETLLILENKLCIGNQAASCIPDIVYRAWVRKVGTYQVLIDL